jgi:hypothetical protein
MISRQRERPAAAATLAALRWRCLLEGAVLVGVLPYFVPASSGRRRTRSRSDKHHGLQRLTAGALRSLDTVGAEKLFNPVDILGSGGRRMGSGFR